MKIYKVQQGVIKELKKPEKNCWIDLLSPTPEELNKIRSFIDITDEVLVSVEDMEEVPKLEVLDDYNFLVLQTPLMMDQEKVIYKTMPLGILYNGNCLVTVRFGKNDVMEYLHQKLANIANNKVVDTTLRPQFVLKLMLFVSKFYLRYLKQINGAINRTHEGFEHAPNNQDILSMMDYGKALSYFSGYLQINHNIYLKITKKAYFTSREDDKDLCEDLLDENLQALEAVKIHNKILHSTISTFSNLISNKLNENVKFLTTFSIILMMPTLVASIYGMNLDLPFQNHQAAFLIVIGLALFLTVILVLFFLRKKLF